MTIKDQKKLTAALEKQIHEIMPKEKDTKHNTMGSRIEWKMKALGLNQRQLGQVCDVPKSSINNAIKDKVKMPSYIKKLAEVLETNVNYLLTGEIDPTVVHVPANTSLLACDTPVRPNDDVDYHIVSIKKGERLYTPKGVEHIGIISDVYIGHKQKK
jgi:transcriptional regulator with XRE-family HTH domain